MAKVERPMIRMVIRNAPLRPVESPILPKISAPIGRTMKPTAKVSSVKTNACASGSPVKNFARMTSAMTA